MKFISHRGESADAPENSLSAFKLSMARDVAGLETDIHLTADNQLVCIHNFDTAEVTGTHMIIEENNYDELNKLSYNKGKTDYPNEKLPLFEELLNLLVPGRTFFIEIKTSDPSILPEMAKLLKKLNIPSEQIYLIAFDKGIIRESKKYMPEIKTQWLTDFVEKDGATSPSIQETIDFLKEAKADGLDARGLVDLFNKEYIDALKAEGFSINVWTIDDYEEAKHFAALGVDFISSNCASKLHELWKKEFNN